MLKSIIKIVAILIISLSLSIIGLELILAFYTPPSGHWYLYRWDLKMYVNKTLFFTLIPVLIYLIIEQLMRIKAYYKKLILALIIMVFYEYSWALYWPGDFYKYPLIIKEIIVHLISASLFPFITHVRLKNLNKMH